MKKTNSEKKSLKRQLVSGTVYVALAAVISAVTINTTVGMLSAGDGVKTPDASPESINVEIPSLPDLPPLTIPEIRTETVPEKAPVTDSAQVSDLPEGVDSTITEPVAQDSVSDAAPGLISVIPDDADLGINKFIKPCDGYVQKEHSAEIPVYSATLADYRIHMGVDVTGEPGTPVCAVIGGIVTDIYDDDLYGKTVCIKSRDGYTVKYSNLLPTLNGSIEKGSLVATGETIGGIGDTALCEAVDPPHVHIEIYDSDGNPVDPEELIIF